MHPIPFSAAVKGQSRSLVKQVLGLPLTSPWPNVDIATGHMIVRRGIKFLFVQAPNLFKSRPFTHSGQLAQNSKAALVERKTTLSAQFTPFLPFSLLPQAVRASLGLATQWKTAKPLKEWGYQPWLLWQWKISLSQPPLAIWGTYLPLLSAIWACS